MSFKKKLQRKRYVKAMMKAIEVTRKDIFTGEIYSKTDGLRVIRSFEEVNNINFNPYNKTHVKYITGMATHENFFRRLKRL